MVGREVEVVMTHSGGLSLTVKSAGKATIIIPSANTTKQISHMTQLKVLNSKFAGDTHFVGGTLSCSSPQLMHTYPEVFKWYKWQRPVTAYTQLTQRRSPAGMIRLSLLFILQFQNNTHFQTWGERLLTAFMDNSSAAWHRQISFKFMSTMWISDKKKCNVGLKLQKWSLMSLFSRCSVVVPDVFFCV